MSAMALVQYAPAAQCLGKALGRRPNPEARRKAPLLRPFGRMLHEGSCNMRVKETPILDEYLSGG